MKAFKISLRKKISLASFGVIVVLGFSVSLAIFFYLQNLLVENKIGEIQRVTTQKAKEVRNILDQQALFIEMLGTRTRVMEFLQDQSDARREELQGIFDEYANKNKNYLSIYLLNEKGDTLIATDRSFIGENYSFREYFKRAMAGEPYSEALLGKTTNQFGYYFSYPAKDKEGKAIGVAVVKVDKKIIDLPLLENLSIGVDDVLLVEENGVILNAGKKDRMFKSLGKLNETETNRLQAEGRFSEANIEPLAYDAGQEAIRNYGQEVEGDMRRIDIYDELEGENEVLAIIKVPNYSFYIIKELNSEMISKDVLPVVYFVSAGIFASSVAVAILIFFLIGYLLNNLKKISEFYEKVGKGDFTKKIEVQSNDELGDLARAFNLMEDNLKDYYKKLETEVLSKTEIANKANDELRKQQKAVLNVLDDVEWEKKNVQKEKDKIEAIIYSIGDGVFVVDEKKKITMINDVTEELSGFSKEELIGEVYNQKLKFIFEKDNQENTAFVDEAINSGKVQEMANHTMLMRKDGSSVAVADSAAPLKDAKGKVIGCVVVFRDVTKEREVDRMKTEFVSLASHQLRTPLTSIKWYSELLLTEEGKDKLKGEKKDFIEEIHNGNNRMIDLVNDLLNVSRIETGKKFVIEKKKMDIVPVVMQAMKDHEVLAKQKNIQLVCEKKPKGKVMLEIDSEKIQQVFHNFISNAIKYSSEGGTVFVGCYDEGDQHIFYVKDQGVGIPKDQQDRIFEKFFRASNVLLTEAEGTGLGLYIAKSIVEGHGGKVWFESVEKKGTTFFVSLPKT